MYSMFLKEFFKIRLSVVLKKFQYGNILKHIINLAIGLSWKMRISYDVTSCPNVVAIKYPLLHVIYYITLPNILDDTRK